jgi:hypothetical protein
MIAGANRSLAAKFVVGVIGMVIISLQCSGQIPGRTTDSIAQDTVNAMIAARDFESAQWYCRRLFEQSEARSDDAAKAAIEFYRVQLAYLRDTAQLNETSLKDHTELSRQYFESYADHRRFPWWQSIELEGQRWIAETLVAEVLIDASKVNADEVSRRLVRIASGIDELRKQIENDRASISAKSVAEIRKANLTPPEDLLVLDRQLAIDRVRIAILQTELYPMGSEEQIASATTAAETADATLQNLPKESAARKTVRLLRVIALRRAGQVSLATEELSALGADSDLAKATAVDLDLADDQFDSAADRLFAYYGNEPQNAPVSSSMDLMRLQWLIQIKADSQKVSQWMESMKSRSGPYSYRRGEAMMLSLMKPKGQSMSAEDPLVLAAQGRSFIRKGDLREGSQLLSSAAKASTNSKEALSLAIEASAANMKASLAQDAINVLLDISRRFAGETTKEFADLHYQAIYLSAHATHSDQVEPLLKEHLTLFGKSSHTDSVRTWLTNLYDQSNRFVDAASVASGEDADRRWRDLMMNPKFEIDQVSRQLIESIANVGESQEKNRRTDLAVEIANWKDAKQLIPVSERATEVARFRSAQSDDLSDSVLSVETRSLMHRLIQDGMIYLQRRQSIAQVVLKSRGKLGPDDGRLVLTALIWNGQDDEAIKALNTFLGEKPTAQSMQETAHSLAQSVKEPTRQKAVEIYDQLAVKLPRGVPQWHQAKWDAIELLSQFNVEESKKRAKYILLTESEIPQPYQSKYESVGK